MSNEYSHLAWTLGDIPRDRDGEYLVYLSKPTTGSRFAICRVRKVRSGNPNKEFSLMITINSHFEWDMGVEIVSWTELPGLEPMDV